MQHISFRICFISDVILSAKMLWRSILLQSPTRGGLLCFMQLSDKRGYV